MAAMPALAYHTMQRLRYFTSLFMLLLALEVGAQYQFLTGAAPAERLPVLWQYCFQQSLSDQDSVSACRFLDGLVPLADSLNDKQLKKYALYFRRCFRLLFSGNYKQHFASGDYETPASIFRQTQAWAQKNNYADIAAACEHYQGEVYFYAEKYGPAFEHLIKANQAFRAIGYANVPAITIYLYDLGLNYYRFEDWDKALGFFLEASKHPFYLTRPQLSTINSIGLIYARKQQWNEAAAFYRKTIAMAERYHDSAWIGITSGNLGNMFLETGKNDSALFYLRKDYNLNRQLPDAPVDAALSAVAIAKMFVKQPRADSALYYINAGTELAQKNLSGASEGLEFRQRLFAALIDLNKLQGNYKAALAFSDSFLVTTQNLRQILDAKIVSRAIHKAEVESYETKLQLAESQKDLARSRLNLLAALMLLFIAIASLLFSRYRMRKRRQAELAQSEKELMLMEKLRSEENLKHAEELLNAYVTTIKEKSALIENLDAELQQLKENNTTDTSLTPISKNVEKLLASTLLTEDDWQHFRNLFQQVHPGFMYRLREKMPGLSPAETRLLILIKLNLSSREMAGMLGISPESIRKARYRLRKKLNEDEEISLETMIGQI